MVITEYVWQVPPGGMIGGHGGGVVRGASERVLLAISFYTNEVTSHCVS